MKIKEALCKTQGKPQYSVAHSAFEHVVAGLSKHKHTVKAI